MSSDQQFSLEVQPIVSYPHKAHAGKTYLMTIDLYQPGDNDVWPYDEEEYPIYCMLETAPLFSNKPLGEPAIVLHRFGGTYGPARFLLTANQQNMQGRIRITLVNGWGVPFRVLNLKDIQVTNDGEPDLYLSSTMMAHSQDLPSKRLEDIETSPSDDLNPYSNTGPIERPSHFFNRKVLIEYLLPQLFSDSVQCLSIVGQRKSGKSSLVKHLAHLATIGQYGYDRSSHLFVYINCARDSRALRSSEDFYSLLLRSLYAEVVKRLPDTATVYAVNLTNPASWQDEWEQLLQRLTNQHFYIIIILDEFDVLVMQAQLIQEGLFGSLRAYGSDPNFSWITCSSQPLPTLFQEAYDSFNISISKRRAESDFYNLFHQYVVGLFEREDIDHLITIPSSSAGISFSSEEQQAIYKFGGRFPYFIQQACSHFFKAHLKGEIKPDEVLESCLKEAQPFWQAYWDNLTSQQQRALYSITSGHPVEASSDVYRLKDAALIYEEDGEWFPFSNEFGRFIRSREHSYVGLPVIQGDLLWKQFEVVEVIGRTLHSQVVKAQDTLLKRYWAIKLLYLNQGLPAEQDQQVQATLLREARILNSLEHKNIGKVHEVRLDPLGVIMPWVEGKSLGTLIEEQAPLAFNTVVKIGIQLADTLVYIHAKGIIHRDIKPNNIILTPDDEAILIDFDVARSATDGTITRSENGSLRQVGTLDYSASEQFEDPESVGPPADIFALGVVLYELITRKRPYPYGNNPKMYLGRLPALEQQDIPDSLFQILSSMLSQEPEQRPSAAVVYQQLQACLSPVGINNRRRSSVKLEDHVTFCARANRIMDRGAEAEQRTVQYLYDHLKVSNVGHYRILVNYNLQVGGTAREIDLLVINKFGVFLLDVKGWLGAIDAYEDAWFINDTFRRENPVESINARARILHAQLFGPQGQLKSLRDVSVIGLVVLVQGLHKFRNHSNSDPRAIVGLDQQLLQSISSADLLFRGRRSRMLSDQEIDNVYKVIYGRHESRKEEIVENYRILKELSFGDLFDAYEAENINIATQRVRLKRYRLQKLSQASMDDDIRHFKRSMEAVFSLGFHPNILISLNFFPDPKHPDVFYEVTELVTGRGGRLDEILARTRRKLSLQEQLDYLEPLCAALSHAHNHKSPNGKISPVYHRNVCPETIFITDDNIVKLGDFDFAKFGPNTINPMYSKDPQRRRQVLIDKPFTAPEILEDASAASAASDIYALGVLWYFLACLPVQDPRFGPQNTETQIDALQLPDAARTLMKRMVAQVPTNRPQHIEDVLHELRQLRG